MLRNIRQQLRHIEKHHLRRRGEEGGTGHTLVSQADRRQMEDDIPPTLANLETTEVRSDDAMSGSFAHTEMTRAGFPREELMIICSRLHISIEVAEELLATMEQRGLMPAVTFRDPSDGRYEAAESEASSQVMESTLASLRDLGLRRPTVDADMAHGLLGEAHDVHAPVEGSEMDGAQPVELSQSSTGASLTATVTEFAAPSIPSRQPEIANIEAQELPRSSGDMSANPQVGESGRSSNNLIESADISTMDRLDHPETSERPTGALPVVVTRRWKTCKRSLSGSWTRLIINIVLLAFLIAHSIGSAHHDQPSILSRMKGIVVSPETEWLGFSLQSCEPRKLESPHTPRNSKNLWSNETEADGLSWMKWPIAKRNTGPTIGHSKKSGRLLIKTFSVSGLLAAVGHRIHTWWPRPPSNSQPRIASHDGADKEAVEGYKKPEARAASDLTPALDVAANGDKEKYRLVAPRKCKQCN